MNKPFWALAGVALLGTIGISGVVIVASSGGEEEAVQQVETATATASQAASGTPVPSPSRASSSTPVSTPGETLTYNDSTYGYSFDYPRTWHLTPPKDTSAVLYLYSYDVASVPPEEAGMPVPKDKLKVLFFVTEGVDKPLREWLEEQRNDAGQPPLTVVSSADITVAEKEGVVEVTEADGVQIIAYYLVIGGDRVLTISGVPADSELWPQFQEVLATLRFAS